MDHCGAFFVVKYSRKASCPAGHVSQILTMQLIVGLDLVHFRRGVTSGWEKLRMQHVLPCKNMHKCWHVIGRVGWEGFTCLGHMYRGHA